MNEISLSIIIPCYNSFHHMKRCLEQFEKYCPNDVEIIIVDDCSTDSTYDELCKYKEKCLYNLTLLQNEVNSGPGSTRNFGLQHAKGKYITFLDSDDFFDNEFWSSILPMLKEEYDCILFDAYIYFSDEKKSLYHTMPDRFDDGMLGVKETIVFVQGSTCGKVYKNSIINRNDIKFLSQNRCEDMPFTKCVVANCSKIKYLKKPLYMYVQQSQSLMHNTALTNSVNAERAFDYIEQKIGDQFHDEVEAIFIKELLYTATLQQFGLKKRREIKDYIKNLELRYPNYLSNKYLAFESKRVKVIVKNISKKRIFILRLFTIIKKIHNKVVYKIK
ncbi:MAG: glycosyltransferase family 2 protein [Bacilli bacterium]|nr:glycosyltransferase family 2 protein [Bacilli bacterium]